MRALQEAQRLRQVCEDIAGGRQQLPDLEWARAAGLKSTRALRAALQAGSAAEKRLVSEHHGFLLSLVKRFTRQVRQQHHVSFILHKYMAVMCVSPLHVSMLCQLLSS